MPEIGEARKGREIGKLGSGGNKRYIWQPCADCGKERWTRIEKGETCSLCPVCANKRKRGISFSPATEFKKGSMSGSNHPNWQGGIKKDRGYLSVFLYPDDFFYLMTDRHGYVREHRLVVAHHLSRCLLAWEVVHHKNGVKDDNRLNNLELLGSKGKHNTLLNKQLKAQLRLIQQLQARVTLLEAENEVFRHSIPGCHIENRPILATGK